MEMCEKITECLCCGGEKLGLVLDMGVQPLANNYKNSPDEKESFYPIGINKCVDCHHVQLTHSVDSNILFNEYSYYSGISQTFKEYCDWFCDFLLETFPKSSNGLVLDIGCNDGTQLDSFKKKGFETIGVDPAKNIFEESSKNHKIYCDFFNENTSLKIYEDYYNSFDFIISQNCFAHNNNPFNMLSSIKQLMRNDTKVLIQTSQADMMLNGQFDTIYHEHVSFFNISSMNALCERVGLYLTDVIKTSIHGTSYIFVIENENKRPFHIKNLIDLEKKYYGDNLYYFTDKVEDVIRNTKHRISYFRDKGYVIAGYGAAAKGNVFLNYSDINVEFIIDDTPQKQNKFSSGKGIPILNSDHLLTIEKNIAFLILPWNFYSEIVNKIKFIRNNPNDGFIRTLS